MPMQEFLATYAVRVDEDGARRLQRILELNREAGAQLSSVFSAAREALEQLKKELSDSAGLPNPLNAPGASSLRLPMGLSGASGSVSGFPGMAALSGLLGAAGATGSAVLPASPGFGLTPDLSRLSQLFSSYNESLTVSADLTEAEEALSDFRARLESERPKLSVNPSGISSAVSSAVSSIRSQMSSLRITVPVTAVPTVSPDVSAGNTGGSSAGSPGTAARPTQALSFAAFGAGGRVAGPTLAMIAEEGRPEYVIPTDDAGRALSLIRSLMGELRLPAEDTLRTGLSDLTSAARAALLPAAAAPSVSSVQAPVTINITAASAAPEAVARCVYDTAERSLLKTLKGAFA